MTTRNDSTLREQILKHLETLKIPLTGEQLDELLAAGTKNKLTHLQMLERLLASPANHRRERSIERRLRLAKFRDPATFESFDWKFNEKTIVIDGFSKSYAMAVAAVWRFAPNMR